MPPRCGNHSVQASAADRNRLGGCVVVEHGQRDVNCVVAARRVEHATGSRPVFDGGAEIGPCISFRRLFHEEPGGTVGQKAPLRQDAEQIAELGFGAVGRDHEIGFDPLPAG